ncbi:hypothetical protein AgCh_022083 [Apium graveolens]
MLEKDYKFGKLIWLCGSSESHVLPPNFIKLAKDVYMPDFIAASDCKLGIHPSIKAAVWEFLLGCFDPNNTYVERDERDERDELLGDPLASELAKHLVILKVNDWLFCHGGLLPHHAAYGIERLNKEVLTWMRGLSESDDHQKFPFIANRGYDTRPGSPESLQQLVEIARNPSSSATGLSGLVAGKEDNLRHSRDRKQTTGLSAATREEYYLLDFVEPDPVGFRNQATGEDYSVEPAESRRPIRALLDVVLLRTTTTGNRVFGALKGALDGGLDIPHSEKRYAGYSKDSKQLDAELSHQSLKRKRLFLKSLFPPLTVFRVCNNPPRIKQQQNTGLTAARCSTANRPQSPGKSMLLREPVEFTQCASEG